jgi:Zn-dependent alcohol dehydrogenase
MPAGPATWTEYTLLSERLVVPLDQEVATDVTSIIGCAVLTGTGVILNTITTKSTTTYKEQSPIISGCYGDDRLGLFVLC